METLSNLKTEEQFGKLFKSTTEKAEATGTYATIPVSTATVERSFSKLKLVKDTQKPMHRREAF